jgi:hypothetical protein
VPDKETASRIGSVKPARRATTSRYSSLNTSPPNTSLTD